MPPIDAVLPQLGPLPPRGTRLRLAELSPNRTPPSLFGNGKRYDRRLPAAVAAVAGERVSQHVQDGKNLVLTIKADIGPLLLLPTAWAGWRNIQNLSQREDFTNLPDWSSCSIR